jgi:hypothetical protein
MDPDHKKKRGRKKKDDDEDMENITVSIDENMTEQPAKKRGRKPKGGKLIPKNSENTEAPPSYPNIILHLKCSMQDLNEHTSIIQQIVTDPLVYNPEVPPSIMTYNSSETAVYSNFNTEGIKEPVNFAYPENGNPPSTTSHVCPSCNLKQEFADPPPEDDSDISMKDVNAKLKKIKLQLYRNANPDKRSACFWCTYDFDNPPCYIPKYEMDGELCGYGSFCRPECAAAFLMRENIDDSTKFERYHLLNLVYSKVYNYKKSIKPAPNPHYLLEKFYGNLTIQEYRKLLKSEHMLLVIEKPMTRILPELHEDTEDFTANIYGGTSSKQSKTGGYKVKRQSEKQKGPSKTAIMKDKFGF